MDFTVDVSEMNALADDFGKMPARVAALARASTIKAAVKTRDAARANARGMKKLHHYPRTITYDASYGPNGTAAEVGPEMGGQGSLGHIIEFGTDKTPPHAHVRPAYDRELPEWLEWMEKIVGMAPGQTRVVG